MMGKGFRTARGSLTARFAADRARLANLQVLVDSNLVAMGVTVANLVLGMVRSHTRREPFTAELDKVLFALKVVGFSSNATASFTRHAAPARRV